MTTSIMTQDSPPAATEGPPRVVPIIANLMPPEVLAARRGRRARWLVLSALSVLLVVVGGWYVVTVRETAEARVELARAEDETQALTEQQRQYADVVKAQQDSQVIKAKLAALLAGDLRWSTVLSSLRAAAPEGVELTAVSASLAEPAQAGGAPAAGDQLPSTSKAKTVGKIDITGTAPSKPQVAAYVDALAKVPNLADPYLTAVTSDESTLQFTLRVGITDTALGGRYTPKTTGGR
jgi:Tfp pilus assembly protein PilN